MRRPMFLSFARACVLVAMAALVLGTLFGAISPLDPTLERTKREIMGGRPFPMCGFEAMSRTTEELDED